MRIDVEDFWSRFGIRLPNADGLPLDLASDLRVRVVEVTKDSAASWACFDARRLEALRGAMVAERALLRDVPLRIDVDRAIGTRRHAVPVDVAITLVDHDLPILQPRDRGGRTRIEARSVLAVVAENGDEVPLRARVAAAFGVSHRVAKDAERNVELCLAGDRTCVTPDARPQIDQHSKPRHSDTLDFRDVRRVPTGQQRAARGVNSV